MHVVITEKNTILIRKRALETITATGVAYSTILFAANWLVPDVATAGIIHFKRSRVRHPNILYQLMFDETS